MSYSVKITSTDLATPEIQSLIGSVQPQQLQAPVGKTLAAMTRRHLAALPSNKRGWPTTGFWKDAVRSTNWQPEQSGVSININKIGVRQRYHGGTIKPVNARALTIPISPEAYGKTVSDFPGAFLITTKKGAYIVQRGEAISFNGRSIKATGRGFASKRVVAHLEFLFKLSSGVTQEANPNVIPTQAQYAAETLRAIRATIAARRKGAT